MRNSSDFEINLFLIRHGLTQGNLLKKYIGRTDESLCPEGIAKIKEETARNFYPQTDFIISSPYRRCIETCSLIYKNQPYAVENDFREMDFGDFEGKNYEELKDNQDYQKWIESNCEEKIKNGESKALFTARVAAAFKKILDKIETTTPPVKNLSLVVHGGTIMSILSSFSKGNYYDFMVENGSGFSCVVYKNKNEIKIGNIQKWK